MSESTLSAPAVKTAREEVTLTDSPRPFRLRRVAGFIRQAILLDVAILTGDKSGRLLATVGLVQIGKAAARRLLKTLRRCGAKSVFCCELGESLVIGATSAIHLMD
jgi:hypothetical protein